MGLGNIGWSGLVLILVALLLIFGPSKLPDIGKAFGKSLKEFRSATKGIVDEVTADPDAASSTTAAATTTAEATAYVEPIELEPQKKSE